MNDLRIVSCGLDVFPEFYRMLQEDFPANEIRKRESFLDLFRKGLYLVYFFYDANAFIGYMGLIPDGKDGILGDYFAIRENNRDRGYGGAILEAIMEKLSQQYSSLYIEAESLDRAENPREAEERSRRLRFYASHGLRNSGLISFAPGYIVDILVADLHEKATDKEILEGMMRCYRSAYPDAEYDKIKIEKRTEVNC